MIHPSGYLCFYTVFSTNCLDYFKYARLNVNEEKMKQKRNRVAAASIISNNDTKRNETKQTHDIDAATCDGWIPLHV